MRLFMTDSQLNKKSIMTLTDLPAKTANRREVSIAEFRPTYPSGRSISATAG
jgi:hypothetical protein